MKNAKENLTQKPFKFFDIFVYFALAAIVASCFILSASAKSEGASFEAYLGGKLVLRYGFDTKSYEIFDDFAVKKTGENTFLIKSGKGYNVIEVDNDGHDVVVTDTDCGTSKECAAMSLKQGSIICVPHSLVIRYGGIPSPKVG